VVTARPARLRPAAAALATLLVAAALASALGPGGARSRDSALAPGGVRAPGSVHAGPPRLLLLVTVDTLRADRLGAYGSARGLTPNLDALAAASVVFTGAYAPASLTVPSLAALMTGRYPEELGMASNESGLPERVPTLAGLLAARGWRTAAVVGNWVLRRGSGLERGFAEYDDRYPDAEAVRGFPERRAPATTATARAALRRCTAGARPCLLWVHYQDPHGPYTPPADLRARYLARERAAAGGTRRLPARRDNAGFGGIPRYQRIGAEREVAFYRSGYDAEVRYLDQHLGRLLADVGPEATVVLAADHGEALGERDYWFAHGALLSDVLVRVPLMVRAPGLAAGRRDDLVALVDVLPTLLGLVTGPAAPPGPGADTLPGRDLFAPGAAARPSVPYLANLGIGGVRRWGLVEGEHALVVEERDGRSTGRLVRRGDDATDLADTLPDVRDRLVAALAARRRALAAGAEARRVTSPAACAQLRALGYLDD